MAGIYQLYRVTDPDCIGKVTFDFDSPAFGTQILPPVKVSGAKVDAVDLENSSADGTLRVKTRYRQHEIVLPFAMEAATYDQILDRWRELEKALYRGAYYKMLPTGGTDKALRIYRVDPIEMPDLWDGSQYAGTHVNGMHFVHRAATFLGQPWPAGGAIDL